MGKIIGIDLGTTNSCAAVLEAGAPKVIPNKDFSKIVKFFILKSPTKGKHISLAKYSGTIFFAGKQGVFKLNNKTNEFEKGFF